MLAEIEEFYNSFPNNNTKLVYKRDLSKFDNHFHLSNINEVEKISASQWRAFIDSLELANSSKNSVIRSVHSFVNRMIEDDIIKSSKITSTKMAGSRSLYVKEEKVKRLIVTNEELKAMFDVANNQEKVMLFLIRYCGLRETETINIKLCDVDVETRKILIHGKGSKQRMVSYPAGIDEYMRKLIVDKRRKCEYLFYSQMGKTSGENLKSGISVNRMVKRLAEESNMAQDRILRCTAHSFRRTFATRLIQSTGDIHSVQQAMGHSSQAITQGYVHDSWVDEMMTNQATILD
jgi:integrase/recombinase XerD